MRLNQELFHVNSVASSPQLSKKKSSDGRDCWGREDSHFISPFWNQKGPRTSNAGHSINTFSKISRDHHDVLYHVMGATKRAPGQAHRNMTDTRQIYTFLIEG